MSGDRAQDVRVQGERERLPGSFLPAQSRASNLLAIALMMVLGMGSLIWYYAATATRQGRARQSAHSAAANRAQSDLPLPGLGPIDGPPLPGLFEPVAPSGEAAGGAPAGPRTLTEIPLAPAPGDANGVAQSAKTPQELALQRQLSGGVFASHGDPSGQVPLALGTPATLAGAPGAAIPSDPAVSGSGGSVDLGTLLLPTTTAAGRAHMMPARRLLLAKGAFIDCTLETAIDSSLPGMTTCITATDTFGVDGKVVLLERGTKLIGETRGQVQQGASRLFVLWSEARTPAGVVVALDSPGADELGRSGLPGEVDRHFWQRFGAAMLVSIIDGAVQAAVQSARPGGAVVVGPSSSEGVLTEILKNTIAIAPTVTKKNGDRIQVLVARDLDFRTVYELRSRGDR